MNNGDSAAGLADQALMKVKQRCRLLMLLEGAEHAGIAPLRCSQLHAFAYLADVLSPVWDLIPFDGKIYKSKGAPHYPDLQDDLDHLVVVGLVQIRNRRFVSRGEHGARTTGSYALNFASERLPIILAKIGARDPKDALDPSDQAFHEFLVELARALATVPNDEIELAASQDATYRSTEQLHSVVDFAEWTADHRLANRSWRVAERFRAFLPASSHLSPGEKLYLYATYLGRVLHAA